MSSQQGPRVGSDHIPVQIELDTKPILISTTDRNLDYSKANWENMKEQLSTINPPVLDKISPDSIDNAVNDLFEHINPLWFLGTNSSQNYYGDM